MITYEKDPETSRHSGLVRGCTGRGSRRLTRGVADKGVLTGIRVDLRGCRLGESVAHRPRKSAGRGTHTFLGARRVGSRWLRGVGGPPGTQDGIQGATESVSDSRGATLSSHVPHRALTFKRAAPRSESMCHWAASTRPMCHRRRTLEPDQVADEAGVAGVSRRWRARGAQAT